jgi:hypothetical protein
MVAMQIKEMELYKLRPAEMLVFDLVALSSVQRNFRTVRDLDDHTDDLHPSNEANGRISRRRIADATGLPRATVGRILERLMKRGMIVEVARGELQVPVGVALQGPYACDLDELIHPVVVMMDQLFRLGIVRARSHGSSVADNRVESGTVGES